MAVVSIEQIAGMLGPGQTLAGLDLGAKTIGLAVSDRSRAMAHARTVIGRTKFTADVEALLREITNDNVGALVIGLPVNMDGTEGPRAQSTRAFVRNLERLSPLPVVLWDERLSTVAAERSLIEMDVSRARRARIIDAAAAAFILQGALDRLRALGSGRTPK